MTSQSLTSQRNKDCKLRSRALFVSFFLFIFKNCIKKQWKTQSVTWHHCTLSPNEWVTTARHLVLSISASLVELHFVRFFFFFLLSLFLFRHSVIILIIHCIRSFIHSLTYFVSINIKTKLIFIVLLLHTRYTRVFSFSVIINLNRDFSRLNKFYTVFRWKKKQAYIFKCNFWFSIKH